MSEKERHPPLVYNAAVFVTLFLLAAFLCQPMYNFTIFEEFRLGEALTATKSLVIDYQVADSHWLAGSWFHYVVLSKLCDASSLQSFVLYKLLTSSFVFFVLCYYLRLLSDFRFLAVFLSALAGSAVLIDSHFSSAYLSYMCFIAFLANLFFCLFKEATRERIVLLALISFLYVNVHVSYFGAALLALILIFASAKTTGINRLKMAVAVLLPSVFTPYLGKNIAPSLVYLKDVLVSKILVGHDVPGVYQYSFALYLLCLAVLVGLYVQGSFRLNGLALLVMIATLILGGASREMLPYASLLAALASGIIWGGSRKDKPIFNGILTMRKRLLGLNLYGLIWLMLCFLIVNVVNLYRKPAIWPTVEDMKRHYIESRPQL